MDQMRRRREIEALLGTLDHDAQEAAAGAKQGGGVRRVDVRHARAV